MFLSSGTRELHIKSSLTFLMRLILSLRGTMEGKQMSDAILSLYFGKEC